MICEEMRRGDSGEEIIDGEDIYYCTKFGSRRGEVKRVDIVSVEGVRSKMS